MKRQFTTALLAACCTALLTTGSAFAEEGSIWENEIYHDDNGHIVIDFEELELLLPESWGGKCQMEVSDDHVSFYQSKSRKLWTDELGFVSGGWMFTIGCSSDYEYTNLPSFQTIGEGSEGIYYMEFPTDVQGYIDDAEALAEFQEMSIDVDWISENVHLMDESGNEAALSNIEDYILPNSSSAYLKRSDLENLTPEEVQMAINEIYARHHRKFQWDNVREYFESKDWYEGTINAEDFDINVMNEYEGANIDLMVNYLDQLQKGTESFGTVIQ